MSTITFNSCKILGTDMQVLLGVTGSLSKAKTLITLQAYFQVKKSPSLIISQKHSTPPEI